MKPQLVKDGPITARRYPTPPRINHAVPAAEWPFTATTKGEGDVVIGALAVTPTWRRLPGLEDRYEVSSEGHIRSLANGRIRSAYCDSDGYLRVCIWTGKGPRSISVHRAVAVAFHGDKQNALHCEVAHLDGNRANPRADNLKWVSKVENRSHRKLHGTECDGEHHPIAKLREQDVIEIRQSTLTYKELAAKFGVSRHAIESVKRRRNWKHVVAARLAPKNGTKAPPQ